MRKPRTIVHLRASNFVGGPEKQILSYVAGGPALGRQVIASFVSDDEGHQLLAAAAGRGVDTFSLPTQTLAAIHKLTVFLREEKVDFLCTHGYKADIIGLVAGALSGTAVLSFLRGWTAEDRRVKVYEALDRALLPLAHRIVCLSETQAAQMSRRTSLASKIGIVPNSKDIPSNTQESSDSARRTIRSRYGFPSDAKVIACAGRLSPEKGTRYFIRAARRLAESNPEMYFVAFGDGPIANELHAMPEARELEGRLMFGGFAPEFLSLLPGVDLLVNPSLAEQSPNVVLEAMANGVPVVATAVGAVPEISAESRCIKLVPPRDVDAIVCAVNDVLRNPDKAREMARAAIRRVAVSLSPQRQYECFARVLDDEQPSQGFDTQVFTPLAESLPLMSVVMPVKNEEKHITNVLDAVLEQEYPRDRVEVLVCDGGSTDSTRQIVRSYEQQCAGRVRLLDNPAGLSSAGRNIGAKASRGEIVMFVDGHCHIDSRYLLSSVAELFSCTGADALCRPQPLDPPGLKWFQKVLASVRATTLGHGRDSLIYDQHTRAFVAPDSSGAIYRREVFDRVGYYDENFDAAEDVEFNIRVRKARLRSYTSPRLTIRYEPRASLAKFWRQMMRYGRGRFRLARKHRDALSISQLVPAFFVAYVVAGIAVPLFSYKIGLAWAAGLLTYVIAVMASSLRVAKEHGLRALAVAPLMYLCIHAGLGIGFLSEGVRSLLKKNGPAHSTQRDSDEGAARNAAAS